MVRTQVTGLPGAGKTTGIEAFLANASGVSFLDIRNFDPPKKAMKFRRAANSTTGNLIAESVIGIYLPGSLVIRLEPPIQKVYQQCLERGDQLDENYLSIHGNLMIDPHYTVRTSEELCRLLVKLMV